MGQTDFSALLDILHGNGAVVAVNSRLARHIAAGYDARMRSKGLLAWPTPAIHPLKAWYKRVIEESRGQGASAFMSEARALALWEGVLSNDDYFKSAYVSDALIETSFDSLELLCEYRITLPESSLALTEEAAALKRWKAAYEEKAASLGAVCPTRLPDAAIKIIKDGLASLPSSVVFAGFDSISPRVASLVEALKERGVEVSFWPGDWEPGRMLARVYDDPAAEVAGVARWIREVFRPGMRIGVVAPDLASYRDLIIREFNAELDPASVSPDRAFGHSPAFNVSLAAPLADAPVVRAALDIVSMSEAKIALARLYSVISSPYVATTAAERAAAGRVDCELKRNNFALAGLQDLFINDLIGSVLGAKVKLWLDVLKKWRGKAAKARPGEWAVRFHDLLNAVKWPGRGLSSVEHQAMEAWNELLAEFAGLDDAIGNIDRASAVKKLSRMARTCVHQPKTPESPVQVLGLLEAAGQTFDKLWIIGAHEHSFPLKPSPNPFILTCLQRERNVPGSSYDISMDEARRMAKRLAQAAPEIIVSHPKVAGDRETKLSAVFAKLVSTQENSLPGVSMRLRDALFGKAGDALESAEPDYVVEMDKAELTAVRGGTSILKDQSACPFRAFAIHRLGARMMEEPEPGLAAREQGDLAHRALEKFWKETGDSIRLKELIQTERIDAAITAAVQEALKSVGYERRGLKHVMNIEKKRIERLMKEWLELENKREAGFAVVAEETKRKVAFECGLVINCKVDRMDKTEDGLSVLIDYKTGKCDRLSICGERPREPQLIAYAAGGSFGAMAFADLKRNKSRFRGFSEKDEVLPGVPAFENDEDAKKTEDVANFADFMKKRLETVERLAAGFVSGDARVAPREFFGNDSPCEFCELSALCRKAELHRCEKV